MRENGQRSNTTPSPKQAAKRMKAVTTPEGNDTTTPDANVVVPDTTGTSSMSVSTGSGGPLVVDLSAGSDGDVSGDPLSRGSDAEMGASPCKPEETDVNQKTQNPSEQESKAVPGSSQGTGGDISPPDSPPDPISASGGHPIPQFLAKLHNKLSSSSNKQ